MLPIERGSTAPSLRQIQQPEDQAPDPSSNKSTFESRTLTYLVVLPDNKKSIKLTRRENRNSGVLRTLKDGDEIEVVLISDKKRAHVVKVNDEYLDGWCQFTSKKDGLNYLIEKNPPRWPRNHPARPKANDLDFFKLIDAGHEKTARKKKTKSGTWQWEPNDREDDKSLSVAKLESKKQYLQHEIEMIESQREIINNQICTNGHSLPSSELKSLHTLMFDLGSKLNALKTASTALNSFVGGFDLDWNCPACTFLNSIKSTQCEMCETEFDFVAHMETVGALNASAESSALKEQAEAIQQSLEESSQQQQQEKLSELIYPATDPEVEMLTERVARLESENYQREVEYEDLKSKMLCMSKLITLEDHDPRTWTTDLVGVWLTKNGLEDYAEDFDFADVDGQALLALTDESLKELEVGRKHRAKILDFVAKMREVWVEGEAVVEPKEVAKPPTVKEDNQSTDQDEEDSPSPVFESIPSTKEVVPPLKAYAEEMASKCEKTELQGLDSLKTDFVEGVTSAFIVNKSYVKTANDSAELTANMKSSFFSSEKPGVPSVGQKAVGDEEKMREIQIRVEALTGNDESASEEALTASEGEDYELI